MAKKYGLKELSTETVCKSFGQNKEGSAKIYFPNLDFDKALELIDEIAEININNLQKHGAEIYPGLKDVLEILSKQYELFIVSNSAETEYVNAFLDSSGTIKYFKSYIAASSLNISKSTAITKVVNEHGLEKAVYVGDTALDLEAANESNVPFIQAKYGFGNDLNTKYYINEIKELPKLLENMSF